ncbi:uncharacterized protein BDW43DRAFT_314265 [Aspergillus alliaceus]|uniref:uncharacterized protein n=1 Tax=Petromyces alliaceus TaxID=209559 RepID=UPI0012A3BBB2|nr:uncharacterized protein BDW43DRAFT_314265 [Aspergillus alliaceus]KAB8230211.1 hypothetical protein BDW43DRAFT_314265 [Aspergillus alliaceus]
MSRVSRCKEFERAALPSEAQLSLHVDTDKFMTLLQSEDRLSISLKNDISARDQNHVLLNLRSINCYMVQKSPVEVLTLREEERETLARQNYERHIAEKLVKACGNADLPQKLDIVPPSWNDDREHDTRLIFKSLVKYIPQILGQCDRQVYRLYQGAPITSNIAHSEH